jgi:hypothetical protein
MKRGKQTNNDIQYTTHKKSRANSVSPEG